MGCNCGRKLRHIYTTERPKVKVIPRPSKEEIEKKKEEEKENEGNN